MDREEEVLELFSRDISKIEKIRLLEDMALDLHNEMEAVDQNMQPELQVKLSEGVRLVTDFLRQLREQDFINKLG